MRYYKNIEGGYINAIGTGPGNTEITAEEYSGIMNHIQSRPVPPDGYDYRLTVDLAWELYKLPETAEEPEEQEATEADYQAALREMGVEV